jgi:hypothetical protein
MSEQKINPSVTREDSGHQAVLTREAEGVIAALRELSKKVSSPVLKECLEVARFDIAYLASGDDNVIPVHFDDDEDESEKEG